MTSPYFAENLPKIEGFGIFDFIVLISLVIYNGYGQRQWFTQADRATGIFEMTFNLIL